MAFSVEVAQWAQECKEILVLADQPAMSREDLDAIVAEYDKEFMSSIGVMWP